MRKQYQNLCLALFCISVVLVVPLRSWAQSAQQQVQGQALVRLHCTRCHVVADINPYGGIGMTPSFGAIKSLPDWQERFEAFWTLLPHPSVVQLEGITPQRPENAPATLKQIMLRLDEVEAIMAYIHTLPAKDLGATIIYK